MIVLGIESSCDETSVAVLQAGIGGGRPSVLSHLIFSQLKDHAPYGGVVPEVAARAHIFHIHPMMKEALARAHVQPEDISLVAATAGPGLVGCLTVGLMAAKGFCFGRNIPLVAVNHLAAHALTPLLGGNVSFPYYALLLSGGHTLLLRVRGVHTYETLAETRDDALGEAFDKVARLVGLEYPGGPALEKMATQGNSSAFTFPRPMRNSKEAAFSFSGIKTAVRQKVNALELSPQAVADICASFQEAIVDSLCERVGTVLSAQAEAEEQHLAVVGGVASNKRVRTALADTAARFGLSLVAPEPHLCTDNAAMVAFCGLLSYQKSSLDELFTSEVRARWPLK